MGYAKLSVTIPEDIYKEIKGLALKKNIKISHFVSDVLAEKTRKMKEEALIQQINDVVSDPDISREQKVMADMACR